MTSMLTTTATTCSTIPRRSKVLLLQLSIVGRRHRGRYHSVLPSVASSSSLSSSSSSWGWSVLSNSKNNRPSLQQQQQQQQQQHQQQKMSFHFGSSDYAKAFQDLPTPDVPALKEAALKYLDNFDGQLWYEDPVSSFLLLFVLFVCPSCIKIYRFY